jgi:peptidoglycan/LPS O-acetylase OafA/YrhL
MTAPARVFEGRAKYVDALRGIAALCVACYHINRYGPLPELAAPIVPELLTRWIDHGWIGVQVFFVISGFVIAYSVRDARVTPGYLGNYALRRSLRLDPPYWGTIALVLGLHAVMHLHLGFDTPLDIPEPLDPPLSWKIVVAHMLYIHKILQYDNLSAGFWTLCIEVQFYLYYVVGLGVAQRLPPGRPGRPAQAGLIGLAIVFAPLSIGSLFWWSLGATSSRLGDPGHDYWLTHFLCIFALGFSAWWALDGRVPAALFWGYVALIATRLAFDWSRELVVALVAGISIYIAGLTQKLGTWLDARWLQYLGRISYSLYLVHFPVAHMVTTFGYNASGSDVSPPGPVAAAIWLLAALAASIAAAHVMYLLVEGPSVRFAARFKRPAQG